MHCQCRAYNTANAAKDSTSFEARKQNLAAKRKVACGVDAKTRSDDASLSVMEQTVSTPVVDAYKQCLYQYNKGLKSSVTFSPDQAQVVVSIEFQPIPGTAPEVEINGYTPEPEGEQIPANCNSITLSELLCGFQAVRDATQFNGMLPAAC